MKLRMHDVFNHTLGLEVRLRLQVHRASNGFMIHATPKVRIEESETTEALQKVALTESQLEAELYTLLNEYRDSVIQHFKENLR